MTPDDITAIQARHDRMSSASDRLTTAHDDRGVLLAHLDAQQAEIDRLAAELARRTGMRVTNGGLDLCPCRACAEARARGDHS